MKTVVTVSKGLKKFSAVFSIDYKEHISLYKRQTNWKVALDLSGWILKLSANICREVQSPRMEQWM